MGALPGNPFNVFSDLWILHKFFNRVQNLSELHFIVQLVQAAMAIPANQSRLLQIGFGIIFPEMSTAMQLAWNKVMRGQHRLSSA